MSDSASGWGLALGNADDLHPALEGDRDDPLWSAPPVPDDVQAVWLSDSPLADGALDRPSVGEVRELPLALQSDVSLFVPRTAPLGPEGAVARPVRGRLVHVQRHAHGGSLVLRDAAGAAYVGRLAPGDPEVVVGQDVTLHGGVLADPFGWDVVDLDPDDLDDVRWEVVAVQRLLAPLLPDPVRPRTYRSDWARARSRDLQAVAADVPALDRSLAYLLWVRVVEPAAGRA